jgi:polygalacturonase
MLKRSWIVAGLVIVLSGAGRPVQQAYWNVRDYGATGDGRHLDQGAINKAIAACAQAGGGTVLVPAGTYLCGSIHLASHINLLIDAGATIMGAPSDSSAYDPAEDFPFTQYQDGGHTFFHNSLIWGEQLEDVSITGRGTINGGGLTSKDREHLGDPTGGAIGTGDKAIALKYCRNVLIRDVTILHGGHFAILATGCDLLTLDNLTIDTNRDGIDVDCCDHTTVSGCRVNSPNDDAICPKSSYALNKPVLTQNLLITHCSVSGYQEGTLVNGLCLPSKAGWSSGRIKFGTESNGGFKNCIVSDCIFRHCNGLALEEVDGGTMANIIVTNLTMEDIHHYPIYVTLGRRNRGPAATTTMGTVSNISISNVIVTSADSLSGIQITGTPGYDITQIRLQHIDITYKGGGLRATGERDFPELDKGYPEPSLLGPNPAYGLFIRHVKDIRLQDITIRTEKPDERPAMICTDVDGLDVIDCTIPKINGVKAFRLERVSHYTVRNSPACQN